MMTDMEPENPSPLLIHMRKQNDKLREQIAAEVADMKGMDLQAVLREIRKLKERDDD